MSESIDLKKVSTHNLKRLDVSFPLDRLTVVTGVSGSGKSSLVFDTLYAESYRRFVDSLSSYARQYLKSLPKADVEGVENLPPAIAVKQYQQKSNQRSTVGTVTELNFLIQTIFTHLSQPVCSDCSIRVVRDNPSSILKKLFKALPDKTSLIILSPLVGWKAMKNSSLKEHLLQQGLTRLLLKEKKIWLEGASAKDLCNGAVIVDQVDLEQDEKDRIRESLTLALSLGKGDIVLKTKDETFHYSSALKCNKCNKGFLPASMALFSYNHPLGACDQCQGYGRTQELDWGKIIPDGGKSLEQEAIAAINFGSHKGYYKELAKSAKSQNIDTSKSIADYTKSELNWLKNGDDNGFGGITAYFEWLNSKKYKAHYRIHAARFQKYITCKDCGGSRFCNDTLGYEIFDKSIANILNCSITEIYEWLNNLDNKSSFIEDISVKQGGLRDGFDEALSRVKYLLKVGVGYLSLNRLTSTLSGGELQRIYMASCLGSNLTDTLYCLDEPTAGLHARDSANLLDVIKELRDQGNTLVVVEHDRTIIEGADHVLRIGPGAGHLGGKIVASPKSINSYVVSKRTEKHLDFIKLEKASIHNLKNIAVKIPVGALTVVCGVSGSGKTSLIRHTLFPRLDSYFQTGTNEGIKPLSSLSKLESVIMVDQRALGRSSRSNIATYLGVFDRIRKLLASELRSKKYNLSPGSFSFNVPGGRCEECRGMGTIVEDLSFLGDVTVTCPKCLGKRFKKDVLSVCFRGKNILEILSLTVEQSLEFFFDQKEIIKGLSSASDLGLGYLTLGQATSSFSGGEAQRLKLLGIIGETRYNDSKRSLLILDEPTTGLSDEDVFILWKHFKALAKLGHTVVVIEHHLDMIKYADWIVELGPEAAEGGGSLVYQGIPQNLKKATAGSWTAKYLR